jgi:guanine nucleotide-binding protein alpha-1 subunit
MSAIIASRGEHRRSLSDPFLVMLRPPKDETPAQREQRILAEQTAKKISDTIDEQIKLEKVELKKNRADVKVLLLGQSESGKSTTLKRECSLSDRTRLVCLAEIYGVVESAS